jgi:Cyclin, N-terminal domain
MSSISIVNRLPVKSNKENANLNASNYSTAGGTSNLPSNGQKILVKGKSFGGFEAPGKIRKCLGGETSKETSEILKNVSLNNQPRPKMVLKESKIIELVTQSLVIAPPAEKGLEESIKSMSGREAYIANETENLVSGFSGDMIETYLSKDKEFSPKSFLEAHTISSGLRAKMVDWMVEVLTSYKCDDATFFLSVGLMDLFLEKSKISHGVNDLHLLGVASMFVAAKYEEVYPLRLRVIYEKIAHKKISMDSIKKKEKEILTTFNFKLTGVTPYEFLQIAIKKLGLRKTLDSKHSEYFEKLSVYLLKMAMYDYELLSGPTYGELALATLQVSCKIMEQIDPKFPFQEKVSFLLNVNQFDLGLMLGSSSMR